MAKSAKISVFNEKLTLFIKLAKIGGLAAIFARSGSPLTISINLSQLPFLNHPFGVLSLPGLPPDGSSVVTQEKVANDTLHYYSYTILFSKSCCKVKLWPSDAGVLPLGVFSLAGLPPNGSIGLEKVANDSLHYPKQYLFTKSCY